MSNSGKEGGFNLHTHGSGKEQGTSNASNNPRGGIQIKESLSGDPNNQQQRKRSSGSSTIFEEGAQGPHPL